MVKLKKLKKTIFGCASALAISALLFLPISEGADLTIEMPDAYNFGTGTDAFSGWKVSKGTETTTTGGSLGTLSVFAVPGSSTTFLVADVVGRAGTGTAGSLWFRVSGVFDRNGTSSMTSVGTSTIGSSSTAGLGNDWFVRWVPASNSTDANLEVKGTPTAVTWVGIVKSMTVSTDGDE